MRGHDVKFRLTALVIIATAVLSLGVARPAGANSSAAPRTIIPLLRLGDVSPYPTLNPNRSFGCDTSACDLAFEHLMTLNANNQLVPQLAISMGHPNRVTYILHLRRGVRFWDGDEMTAADVAYSLNYELAPGSFTASTFANVKTFKATNKYTVVVILKHPDASFKYNITTTGVVFEKKFEQAHPTTFGDPGTLIEATGPWEIDSFDPTRGMQLSANPHWWGGTVPIKHVSVTYFTSETSEALAMRAGDIDVAFPLAGPAFAATSGAKLTSCPWNVLYYFSINAHIKPWNDIHVRRALAFAVNRGPVVTANGGTSSASPLSTIIVPDALRTVASKRHVDALLQSLPQYPYDLAKARQQMALSAHPKGFNLAMDVPTNNGEQVQIAEVLAAQLQKIGINVKLNVVPFGTWLSVILGPRTFGLMLDAIGVGSPDPSGVPNEILGSSQTGLGGENAADYAPKSVEELLTRGLTTSNENARFAIYGELLKKLAVDLPYVPLIQTVAYAAISSKFSLPAGEDKLVNFTTWALRIKA
jgi:peptide/nickel transport system substrate-binding protein